MRRNDVFELIGYIKKELINVEKSYYDVLEKKRIDYELQINVKNLMENMRSTLDYMAHDIYDKKCKPNRLKSGKPDQRNIYFPYGIVKNDFESMMGNYLADLKDINVRKLIESIQPYESNNSWLYDLCKIVNENKHDKLTPQTTTKKQTMTATRRTKEGEIRVTMPINDPNFRVTQGKNCQIFVGGIPVKMDSSGITPLSPGLKRTVTTWVSIHFQGTNINVLELLKTAIKEIDGFSNRLYKLI